MLDPRTDYSPDLEWMLQSGQAPDSLIIETLVQEYYDPVYRYCISVLEDKDRAHQATRETFVYTVRHAHRYRSQESVQAWLYRAANRCCRQVSKGGFRSPRGERGAGGSEQLQPESEAEAEVWQALNTISPEERLLLLLCEVQQLPPEEVSPIFRTEAKEIEARLDAARLKLQRQGKDAPLSEETCRQALARRWPAPSEMDEQRQEAAAAIQASSGRKSLARLPLWQVGGAILAGLLLLGFLLSGLGNTFFAEPRTPTATPQARQRGRQGMQNEVLEASGAGLRKMGELPRQGETALPSAAAGQITPSGEAQAALSRRLILPRSSQILEMLPGRSGPASLAVVLEFWGWNGEAEEIEQALQPNPDDANTMPYELLNFVEDETNFKAIFRVGGEEETLRSLIEAGFPVIIERAYVAENGEWSGGYQVIDGYYQPEEADKARDDSKAGIYPDGAERFSELEPGWRVFNYLYILVYPAHQEARLLEALGSQAVAEENFRQAAQRASEEIYSLLGVDKFFAWFNRGTSLSFLDDYTGAALAYDEAFAIFESLPENKKPNRILWYQSRPFWAYYYTARYEDVIRLANSALNESRNAVLEESYYWRALAKEALGDEEGAIADLEEALYLNPNFSASLIQLNRIKEEGS
jgi:RNA polymerase sigma factor (sigma-70 family)